ncbi:MAG: WecB/TagA/CpsF family glycosyltransferase [Vicinamibacteria bacterium]
MAHANFLGTRVDALTLDDLTRRVAGWLVSERGPSRHVACLNAYCVTLALYDESLRCVYARADVAGPDGMPFARWIRRTLRVPCDRLYGPDVMLHLMREAELRGWSVYLYGGAPDVSAKLAGELARRFPGLRLAGRQSPPFRPATPEEDAALVAELAALRPDLLLVGLGTPKQDFWIDAHRESVRGTVMFSLGAAFDFFGGRVRQAPRFVQRSGFEWLWRLFSRDFFRLFRRYTLLNAVFLWNFALQQSGLRAFPLPPAPAEPGAGSGPS